MALNLGYVSPLTVCLELLGQLRGEKRKGGEKGAIHLVSGVKN